MYQAKDDFDQRIASQDARLAIVKAGTCYTYFENAHKGDKMLTWDGKDISHVTYCKCPGPEPPPQPGVTVTNTLKKASLEVTKRVDWNGESAKPADFVLCVTGPSYPQPTLDNGGCQAVPFVLADYSAGVGQKTVSWSTLQPGNYTVSEAPAPGWTVQVTPASGVVTVADGTLATALVTNTRQRGLLRVTKAVDWRGITPEVGAGLTFRICITGPSHPGGACQDAVFTGAPFQTTLLWDNLVAGDYIVTEDDPGEIWTVVVSPATVAVPAGPAGAAATVTNSRKLGALAVTKDVLWNGVPVDPNRTFTLCISGASFPVGNCQTIGSAGGTLTWPNLIPGLYTLSEQDPGPEWTVTLEPVQVTVPANGGTAQAKVTNSHTVALGSLAVKKVVNWFIDPNPTMPFEICIQGPSYPSTPNCQFTVDQGTATWSALTPGLYTVTETSPGRNWIVQLPPPVLVTAPGPPATATVTNIRVPTDLPSAP